MLTDGSEGIEDLTGGVTTEVFSTDVRNHVRQCSLDLRANSWQILDKDKFWKEELMNVNKQFLFGCGQMGGLYGQRRGIQEKHAYSIMEAREIGDVRLLKLRCVHSTSAERHESSRGTGTLGARLSGPALGVMAPSSGRRNG